MENDNKTTGIVRSIVILVSVFALAAAAIVCTFILTRGFVEAKSGNRGGLSATGSASLDFEADLIVWRGTYSAYAETTGDAYAILNRDADKIRRYLDNKGIGSDDIVFSAIEINRRYNSNYNEEGNYVGD